jgi:hypothetical protein
MIRIPSRTVTLNKGVSKVGAKRRVSHSATLNATNQNATRISPARI